MNRIPQGAHRVNSRSARTKRYFVPSTGDAPRTAAVGYFDTGILRSIRTSGGRRYGNDEIAFLESVINDAVQDGLTELEVVITYNRTNSQTTYATTIEQLRTHGRRVMGVSGWELSMPRYLWSIDGNPPTGLPTPPKHEPSAIQAALFAFDEPRKAAYA